MTRIVRGSELTQEDVGALIQWESAGWDISGVVGQLQKSNAGVVVTPVGAPWSTRAIRDSYEVTVLREAPGRAQTENDDQKEPRS